MVDRNRIQQLLRTKGLALSHKVDRLKDASASVPTETIESTAGHFARVLERRRRTASGMDASFGGFEETSAALKTLPSEAVVTVRYYFVDLHVSGSFWAVVSKPGDVPVGAFWLVLASR